MMTGKFTKEQEHSALDDLLKPEKKGISAYNRNGEVFYQYLLIKYRYEAITKQKLRFKSDMAGHMLYLFKENWKPPVYDVDHIVEYKFED